MKVRVILRNDQTIITIIQKDFSINTAYGCISTEVHKIGHQFENGTRPYNIVLEATGAKRVVSCKYQESSLREIKAKG